MRSILLLMVIMSIGMSPLAGQNDVLPKDKAGYWEGEFMPGNGLTLILYFKEDPNMALLSGRLLLYQGQLLVQDDALTDISLNNDSLSFVISPKQTTFSGHYSATSDKLFGVFLFPDKSEHPVDLKRVNEPSFSVPEHVVDMMLNTKLPAESLREDFDFLREHLEQEHPQLYLYTSRKEFNSIFDSVAMTLSTELTQGEFFRRIAPVVAKVRCLHTDLRFSDHYEREWQGHPGFLPLDINMSAKGSYVVHDLSGLELIEPGSQLISINGTTMHELKEQLLVSIPADGMNTSRIFHSVNRGFSEVYARYFGLCEAFDIEYRNEGSDIRQITLSGLTLDQLHANRPGTIPGSYRLGDPPISWDHTPEISTALLRIRSFYAADMERYTETLRQFFRELKTQEIDNLLLDLRGNAGGHPLLSANLLTYLVDTPFTYFTPMADPGELEALSWKLDPAPEQFGGSVYVLMDGGCLSSTGHFISLLSYHKAVELIGQESGGSFFCNDGSIQITLPETQIRMNLPTTTFQAAVPGLQKGHRLYPTHQVTQALTDILVGQDTQLDYALELIGSTRKKKR